MDIHWTPLKLFPGLGENVFNRLAIALLSTFLIWYVRYHWRRRRLYKIAAQSKGPFALPFIGSVWYFIGHPDNVLNKMLKLANEFDSPVPLWVGQQLQYAIWKPEQLEVIMKSPHALNKNYMYELFEMVLGKGLFTAPASIWKRHKKIIMPTFNQKILDDYVEIFTQNAEILCKKLKKEVENKAPDVYEAVSRCTFNIFCETAMGLKLNSQIKDSDFFDCVSRGTELLAVRVLANMYLPDFFFRQTRLWKEGMKILDKFHSTTYVVVKEGIEAYNKKIKEKSNYSETGFENKSHRRKTFVQQLIEMSEEGTKFTDQELQEEVKTFLVGGTDTTSTAMSFVLLILGMFPQVQNKVYEEVIDVLGPNKSVEYQGLGSFQYLERVIKETLRIFPTGPFLGRSITEDIKLEMCTIPKGCSVLMSIIALHRDPEVWPNPLEFDPDRFLPEQIAKRHPFNYLPFLGGLRSCPGSNYAMMSMKCIIATIVRRYRIFTDYKSIEDVKLMFSLLLKPIDGFKLSLTLR